jgi:hypothetical protein
MDNLNNYNIELITDWETIYSKKFQKKWLIFYENMINSNVFSNPNLCIAWLDTYRPIRNLKPVFCIAKNEDTTIFLPLVLWQRNWKNAFQKLIIPVGHSDFDYHDPLIISENKKSKGYALFLKNLVNELKEKIIFDKIYINGLRKGDSNLVLEENDIAPFTVISNFSDNNQYILTLDTKLRGDLRRQVRRLNEKGTLTMVSYSKDSISASVFSKFMKEHSRRWPNAYKAPSFHENIINCGLIKGIVHFSALKVDDEVISWHLGFVDKKTFYYYMPAINGIWQKYSPGKVHLLYLVNHAIELRLEIFDHLRGKENYKNGWAPEIQKLFKIEYQSKALLSKIKNKIVNIKSDFL